MAYCMKCKKQTTDKGAQVVKSGSRFRQTSTCGSCGTNKSAFVSSEQAGKGFKKDLRNLGHSLIQTGATFARDTANTLYKKANKHIDKYVGNATDNVENKYLESRSTKKKLEGLKKSVELQTHHDDNGRAYTYNPVSGETKWVDQNGDGRRKRK